MSMITARQHCNDKILAPMGSISMASALRNRKQEVSSALSFIQPNLRFLELVSGRHVQKRAMPTLGETGDPYQLKAFAPYLYHLDVVRRRYAKRLRHEHGRSNASLPRKAILMGEVAAALLKRGGPYKLAYVRDAACQIINPHRRWPSGIRAGVYAERVNFEDVVRGVPNYDDVYGDDVDITPAFVALIEATKEVHRRRASDPWLRKGLYRPNPAVIKVLSGYGFTAVKLADAASLLITTPGSPKPKRKTASEKKPKLESRHGRSRR